MKPNKKSRVKKKWWLKQKQRSRESPPKQAVEFETQETSTLPHDHESLSSGSFRTSPFTETVSPMGNKTFEKTIETEIRTYSRTYPSSGIPDGIHTIRNAKTLKETPKDGPPLSQCSSTMLEATQGSDEDESYNFEEAFISEAECRSVLEHELTIEKITVDYSDGPIKGHRIVEPNYLLNVTLAAQFKHSTICTTGLLQPFAENTTTMGLASEILLRCNMCNFTTPVKMVAPKNVAKLNTAAVWGTLATGSTYSHLKERLSVMDIPYMHYTKFHKIEEELLDIWKDALWKSMEAAGKEEYEKASEKGQIDKDGIVWTTVYLDGGWSHRSYGHNYNAASGTIQGQLNICQRQICFFIVYVNDTTPLHVEAILRDVEFWETKLLPKLVRFYSECVLPEIIYRRKMKHQKIRDPEYITHAKALQASKKVNVRV